MKRIAIAKAFAVGVLGVLILAGAAGIYYYTSPQSAASTTSTTATSSSSSAHGPASGWQNANGQPEGVWADYLGYIPAGYVLAPHMTNEWTFQCPSGMDTTQCKLFQESCGNGVCDPNESCTTCPVDCGVPGSLTCDPYTGRAAAPTSICEVLIQGQGAAG